MSRKPTFNVVVVYDDFYSALRAQELAGRMAAELEPVFVLRTEVWNFELATHADLCDRAAKDAIEADMVIISASTGEDLPSGVKGWMQSWLPQKRGGLAALVALVNWPAGRGADTPPAAASLRQMAKAAWISFAAREGRARTALVTLLGPSIVREWGAELCQAGSLTPVPPGEGTGSDGWEWQSKARRVRQGYPRDRAAMQHRPGAAQD